MHNRRRRQKGIALVAILIVMVLLMGIGAALHVGVIGETALRGAHARAVSGFYAAEAGINRGMGEYRNIFLSFSTPGPADFAESAEEYRILSELKAMLEDSKSTPQDIENKLKAAEALRDADKQPLYPRIREKFEMVQARIPRDAGRLRGWPWSE